MMHDMAVGYQITVITHSQVVHFIFFYFAALLIRKREKILPLFSVLEESKKIHFQSIVSQEKLIVR